jgi:hypothetical protein
MLALALLAACGGGSGNDSDNGGVTPFPGEVAVTCADSVASLDQGCKAILESYHHSVPTTIYNGGTKGASETAWAIADVKNDTGGQVYIYARTDFIYNGCDGLMNRAESAEPMPIAARTTWEWQTGAAPCYGCPSSCVQPGPVEFRTTIYKAVGADPFVDGNILAKATLRFNLVP